MKFKLILYLFQCFPASVSGTQKSTLQQTLVNQLYWLVMQMASRNPPWLGHSTSFNLVIWLLWRAEFRFTPDHVRRNFELPQKMKHFIYSFFHLQILLFLTSKQAILVRAMKWIIMNYKLLFLVHSNPSQVQNFNDKPKRNTDVNTNDPPHPPKWQSAKQVKAAW